VLRVPGEPTKTELYYKANQLGLIFDFKDSNKRARGIVLRTSYMEIEEIVSSKFIMMEGVTNTLINQFSTTRHSCHLFILRPNPGLMNTEYMLIIIY
jgi:hypothetical protein